MAFATLFTLLAIAALAAGLPSSASPWSTQAVKMCSDLGKTIIPIPEIGVWNGTRQIGYLSILPSSVYGAGYSISPDTDGALTGVYLCGNPTIASPTILSGSNALNFSNTDSTAISIIAPSWPDFRPTSTNWAVLGPAPVSQPGALPNTTGTPSWVQGTPSYWESAVWTVQSGYDSAGNYHNKLIPYWVNQDGSRWNLTIAASGSATGFVLTGNFRNFIASFTAPSVPWYEVFFSF